MSDNITFSVIIPVYNVEKYLLQCVQSVLNQTYQNFEIVIIDDGSTDSSPAICDELAGRHENISVYHQKNSGLIATRRTGISKAVGKWIVHLDSDDCLRQESLEILYSNISKYPEVDCMIMGIERFTDRLPEKDSEHDSRETYITDKKETIRKILFDESYTSLVRKVAKRELVGIDDLSPYYHIQLGEDMVQSLEILKYCNNFLFIPNKLYQYRINPKSLTQTIDYSKLNISCEKENLVFNFLKENSYFSESDFEEYRDYHSRGTCVKLVEIATACTSVHHKERLYKQCHDEPFISEFVLGNRPSKYRTLNLLRDEKYRRLLLNCLWIKAKSVILRRPLSF